MNGELHQRIEDADKEIRQIEGQIQKLRARLNEAQARRESLRSEVLKEQSDKLAKQDWERKDHDWSSKLTQLSKEVFGIKEFRPYQLSTMNATLSGQDCILLMPTGGGKSLCFQLPALVSEGITLVVCPLVSLIEDQLFALKALGVEAAMLSAATSQEEAKDIQNAMIDPKAPLKILYVTPEKLAKSKRFMAKVQKMFEMGRFARLAIDEVHCCSQWGHDFRPDYKFLGVMKRQFPSVPILGLTATATTSVIQDVQKLLNIEGCLVLRASFNRPNLFYKVVPKPSSSKEMADELEMLLTGKFKDQTGIIYCFSIKDTEEVASDLRKRGIAARSYHAQTDSEHRTKIHQEWRDGKIQVVVATVAFGMGIDKPNVRFVIHHSLPKAMETYYQESGRAGRDDKPAECILYYRLADVFRISSMVFTEQTGLEKLYAMIAYCLDVKMCRRNIIAQHFGENWEASDCNKMCDHCQAEEVPIMKEVDLTKYFQVICSILKQAGEKDERMTCQKLLTALEGKEGKKLLPSNEVKLSRDHLERLLGLLLMDHYLKEDFHFTPYATICYLTVGPVGKVALAKDHKVVFELPTIRKRPRSPEENSSSKKIKTSEKKSEKSKGKNNLDNNDKSVAEVIDLY